MCECGNSPECPTASKREAPHAWHGRSRVRESLCLLMWLSLSLSGTQNGKKGAFLGENKIKIHQNWSSSRRGYVSGHAFVCWSWWCSSLIESWLWSLSSRCDDRSRRQNSPQNSLYCPRPSFPETRCQRLLTERDSLTYFAPRPTHPRSRRSSSKTPSTASSSCSCSHFLPH